MLCLFGVHCFFVIIFGDDVNSIQKQLNSYAIKVILNKMVQLPIKTTLENVNGNV